MKFFVFFAVCLVMAQALTYEQLDKLKKHRSDPIKALTNEQLDKLKKHRSECLIETKADEQLVTRLKHSDIKARTNEQLDKLKKHKSECLIETKADEQLVTRLKNSDFKKVNDATKKYAHCMLIKSELMTKEGKFMKDVALDKVLNNAEKALIEDLIDICMAYNSNNPQQNAWNYVKCFYEINPRYLKKIML